MFNINFILMYNLDKTVYKRYQFFEQFDFFKGIQRSMLESFLHGLDSKLCK